MGDDVRVRSPLLLMGAREPLPHHPCLPSHSAARETSRRDSFGVGCTRRRVIFEATLRWPLCSLLSHLALRRAFSPVSRRRPFSEFLFQARKKKGLDSS